MKCKWIIENFTDSEDYNELIAAAQEQGHDCYVIGRRNNFDFNPTCYKEGDCVLFQGSIQMTRHCHKVLPKGCFPISYCTEPNYLCSAYWPAVTQFLFNDKFAQTTVKELKDNRFDFYRQFGKEALIYIRPDRGDKPFSGQLLDLQDFDQFWKNNIVCTAEDGDTVFVSTPKQINGEYRFVVTKYKEIVAHSTYQYQGQKTLIPFVPPGAIKLVEQVLEVGYYPDSVFVMDVAEDADGNFWLIEFNSFSSAGLYACEKSPIIRRVSEIAENEHFLRAS